MSMPPTSATKRAGAAALVGLLVLAGVTMVGRITPGDARGRAGVFDYLTLVLSWSPTFCRGNARARRSRQCTGRKPHAFVLHGLWPQYERGYPQSCPTRDRPWVPGEVIRDMLDIMPARGLIIHQYKKHGTCAGLDARDYFALSRQLYDKVRIPPRLVRPTKPLRISPREIENEFLRVNPGLEANMISIACGRRARLVEIRICFSRNGKLARCGENENQRRLCRKGRITVPPVRAASRRPIRPGASPPGHNTRPRDGRRPREPQKHQPDGVNL